MEKPYIICYMMTSVDGRIDCDMVGRLAGVEDYYPLLDELGLQSAVSGKITARLELAEPGEFKVWIAVNAEDNRNEGNFTYRK